MELRRIEDLIDSTRRLLKFTKLGGSWIKREKTWPLFVGVLCMFLLLPMHSKVHAKIDDLDEIIKQVEAEIETNMKTHEIPGMAFALADASGIVYSKGFGVLDSSDETGLIDEHTNFNLGSLSKVFTSLAIMQLHEKGQITLEDPVVNHLPWFKTNDPLLSNQITIKHLLNHSSGLPGRLNVHEIKSIDKQDITNEIIEKLNGVTLVGQPGEVFEYTNMNTDLLQIIIEEKSGESIVDFMRENIFEPLEMSRTGYFTFNGSHLSNSAVGHRYHWGKIKPYEEKLVYATSSSAGLSSNVVDLGKFITFLINDSKISSEYLLSIDSINEMFKANQFGVGYNWFIYPHNKFMDGGLPGFTSTMVLSSDKTFGLVLLSNSKQDITLHSGFNLYRIVEGGKPKPLLDKDFPKVNFDAKIILGITTFIFILFVYGVASTLYNVISKKKLVEFRKMGISRYILLTLILVMFFVGIYYIYVIIPISTGVPSLFAFQKEPDITAGFVVLSIVYSAFSIFLFLKTLLIQKVMTKREPYNIVEANEKA